MSENVKFHAGVQYAHTACATAIVSLHLSSGLSVWPADSSPGRRPRGWSSAARANVSIRPDRPGARRVGSRVGHAKAMQGADIAGHLREPKVGSIFHFCFIISPRALFHFHFHYHLTHRPLAVRRASNAPSERAHDNNWSRPNERSLARPSISGNYFRFWRQKWAGPARRTCAVNRACLT